MEVFKTLEEAITAIIGSETRSISSRPVFGGDINRAFRLTLSDGRAVFMKSNAPKNLRFFETEAKGLEALRQTDTIGVPQVLGIGADKNEAFLLLEYLDAAPKING